jgi:DNA-binding GntR family transcriptional regulator
MDQDNPEHRKYMLVAALLNEEIRNGLRVPGGRLPSIAELCTTHCISRQTGGKAMKVLAREGLIYRQPGLGWFVAVPR